MISLFPIFITWNISTFQRDILQKIHERLMSPSLWFLHN